MVYVGLSPSCFEVCFHVQIKQSCKSEHLLCFFWCRQDQKGTGWTEIYFEGVRVRWCALRRIPDVGYWLWWIVVEIIIVFLRRATNHDSVETTPFFLVAFFLSFASGKESEW